MVPRKIHSVAILVCCLIGFVSGGCKKSTPTGSPPSDSVPAPSTPVLQGKTLARIHWLGKTRLMQEGNATNLAAIWKLPESTRLEAQTLNKLATAGWRLFAGSSNQPPSFELGALTNAVRSLLQDVVGQECYLEILAATNGPKQSVLAVELTDEQAASWETNLVGALRILTGIKPAGLSGESRAWSLGNSNSPDVIRLVRARNWTLLGVGQERNVLLDDFLGRIKRSGKPYEGTATNGFLNVYLGARSFKGNGITNLVSRMPELSLDLAAAGEFMVATGELTFDAPLQLPLEPWNIPTNLIDGWLASFTAARGIEPWLSSSALWTRLGVGPAPNQLFSWSQFPSRMQTYCAAPLSNASNVVDHLSDLILQNFPVNDFAMFDRSTSFNGLEWRGTPYMTPFLRSISSNGEFVLAGFFPDTISYPIPTNFFTVLGRTNLVYYDWDMTGVRIEDWIFMGQFIRFALQKAQLPADSASISWLRAITPRLKESTTQVFQSGETHISFSRRSAIGFTALELQLLADWLESPDFPFALNSFQAAPRPVDQ